VNTLTVALQNGIQTVAFPAISCGAYGYPWQEAVEIAVSTTIAFVKQHPDIAVIYFVVYNESLSEIYENELKKSPLYVDSHVKQDEDETHQINQI